MERRGEETPGPEWISSQPDLKRRRAKVLASAASLRRQFMLSDSRRPEADRIMKTRPGHCHFYK